MMYGTRTKNQETPVNPFPQIQLKTAVQINATIKLTITCPNLTPLISAAIQAITDKIKYNFAGLQSSSKLFIYIFVKYNNLF